MSGELTAQGLIDFRKSTLTAVPVAEISFPGGNTRRYSLEGSPLQSSLGIYRDRMRDIGDIDYRLSDPRGGLQSVTTTLRLSDLDGDPSNSFASGTGFRNFGSGTRATLHGEETVMTRPQVDRLVSMAVAGAPGSTVPQGGGGQPIVVHVVMDGHVVATALTNTLEAEGPEAQRFRQANAGRE